MASSKTKQAAEAAGPATRALRVVAKRPTFYRAGRAFGAEPVTIALSELTPEHYEAITSEPMLVASEVDVEQAAA